MFVPVAKGVQPLHCMPHEAATNTLDFNPRGHAQGVLVMYEA